MGNTIETCRAEDACIAQVTDPEDIASLELSADDAHISIDNGCSHVYLISGSPRQMRAFVRRLHLAVEAAADHVEARGLDCCPHCQRPVCTWANIEARRSDRGLRDLAPAPCTCRHLPGQDTDPTCPACNRVDLTCRECASEIARTTKQSSQKQTRPAAQNRKR